MRLDHLSFAAGPEGLEATSAQLAVLLGASFSDGGYHPRFGTRNHTLALSAGRYVEVVEVLDHPAADKAPFGQAVRARSAEGGGWLGWVVAVEDLGPVEERLGRPAVEGHRDLPTGERLEWHQIGVLGLRADPQLPFFVRWLSDPAQHPSAGGGDVQLSTLEIAGEHERVDNWLGGRAREVLADVDLVFTARQGQPGLVSATFETPHGSVRI